MRLKCDQNLKERVSQPLTPLTTPLKRFILKKGINEGIMKVRPTVLDTGTMACFFRSPIAG